MPFADSMILTARAQSRCIHPQIPAAPHVVSTPNALRTALETKHIGFHRNSNSPFMIQGILFRIEFRDVASEIMLVRSARAFCMCASALMHTKTGKNNGSAREF